MPMLEVWREPHKVARPHLFDRSAVALHPSQTGSDDQGLSERMSVPVGASPGLKGDVTSAGPRRIGCLKERVYADRSGEPGRRALARGTRAVSLDLDIHVSAPSFGWRSLRHKPVR